jgi:hypothetical protein
MYKLEYNNDREWSGARRDPWKALAKQTGWKIKNICPLRNVLPCAIELVPVGQNENVSLMGLLLQNPIKRLLPSPRKVLFQFKFSLSDTRQFATSSLGFVILFALRKVVH